MQFMEARFECHDEIAEYAYIITNKNYRSIPWWQSRFLVEVLSQRSASLVEIRPVQSNQCHSSCMLHYFYISALRSDKSTSSKMPSVPAIAMRFFVSFATFDGSQHSDVIAFRPKLRVILVVLITP